MATNPTDNKDLVSRLKDAGEDALQKLGDVPGGKKALEAITACATGSTTSRSA